MGCENKSKKKKSLCLHTSASGRFVKNATEPYVYCSMAATAGCHVGGLKSAPLGELLPQKRADATNLLNLSSVTGSVILGESPPQP